MVEIILCDDDPFILKIAKETIQKVIHSYYLEVKIACVSVNYREIIGFIEENVNSFNMNQVMKSNSAYSK